MLCYYELNVKTRWYTVLVTSIVGLSLLKKTLDYFSLKMESLTFHLDSKMCLMAKSKSFMHKGARVTSSGNVIASGFYKTYQRPKMKGWIQINCEKKAIISLISSIFTLLPNTTFISQIMKLKIHRKYTKKVCMRKNILLDSGTLRLFKIQEYIDISSIILYLTYFLVMWRFLRTMCLMPHFTHSNCNCNYIIVTQHNICWVTYIDMELWNSWNYLLLW